MARTKRVHRTRAVVLGSILALLSAGIAGAGAMAVTSAPSPIDAASAQPTPASTSSSPCVEPPSPSGASPTASASATGSASASATPSMSESTTPSASAVSASTASRAPVSESPAGGDDSAATPAVTVAPSPSASPGATDGSSPAASPRDAQRATLRCPPVPLAVTAKPGRSKVVLAWQSPATDGPSVASYLVRIEPGGRTVEVAATRPGATIADLDNGIEYSFSVMAVNEYGASGPSPTVTATPSLGEPAQVERLIVAYEPGVAVTEAPGRATGSSVIDEVALIPDVPLGAGMRTVELSEGVSQGTAERMAAELTADPRVKWAEPDERVSLFSTTVPNDLYYANGSMWGLNGTYGIKAPQAWAITQGSPSIVVAVLDTGIAAHPDLAGQTVAGYDMVSDPIVGRDGDGRDADPSDPGDTYLGGSSSWHGTHVSGTINAVADNAIGVAGVAPRVKVQHVRVLGSGGGYMSDIVAGITWASGGAVAGVPANPTPARVISMSLGGGSSCGIAERTAIAGAVARNTVVVVAAGNSDLNAASFTPASCEGVIAVGAIGSNGKRAYFSNYGPLVDVAAPGMSIVSTLNSGSTNPAEPSYAFYSGTSMATPHVSGVVALMLSQNPSLTPAQVEARIKAAGMSTPFPGGACDAVATKTCGAGIINAAALLGSSPAPTPVTGVSVTPATAAIATGATVQLSATVVPVTATNKAVTWSSSNPAVATVGIGGLVTGVGAGTATISATTADGGFLASAAVTVNGTVPVTGVSVAPTTLEMVVGAVGTLTATVAPANATNRTVSWSSADPAIASVAAGGVVTAKVPGTTTITVTTADGARTASATVNVGRQSQTITFTPPASLAMSQSPFSLTARASSGLPVTFTANGSCTVAGAVLTLLRPGSCTVTASQAGSSLFLPATPVPATITVGKRTQRINVVAPPRMAVGSSVPVIARATSGLPVTLTSNTPTVCTISGTRLESLIGGTCSFTASQPGSDAFEAAADVTQSVMVIRRTQTIVIDRPSRYPVSASPVTVSGAASSGLPVTWTSASPTVCTIAGTSLTLLARGSCQLQVTQAGDGTWEPVTRNWTITVTGLPQAITFPQPPSGGVNGSPLALAATSSSGLAVAYTVQPPSVCAVVDGSLKPLSAGQCWVTASQPGDLRYDAAAPISRTVTIAPAVTRVTVGSSAATAVVNDRLTFTATVTDASGAPASDRKVSFYARVWSPWSGGFSLIGTARTDAAGVASMVVSYDRANRYEVLAEAAASTQAASARGSTLVDVARIQTSTTVQAMGSASAAVPVSFEATVTPQDGPVRRGLTVTFSSRVGTGGWVYRGVATTDDRGRAMFPVTFSSAGPYEVRAEVTGTNVYAPSVGTTGTVEVSRRR